MLKSFDPPQDFESNENGGSYDSNFSTSENRAAFPAFVDVINHQIGKVRYFIPLNRAKIIHLMQILRDAYQRLARFTEAFIGYMRRVAAAVVILAASLSSTLSDAMPSSMNLKRCLNFFYISYENTDLVVKQILSGRQFNDNCCNDGWFQSCLC